jgi:hypothetical protein
LRYSRLSIVDKIVMIIVDLVGVRLYAALWIFVLGGYGDLTRQV